MAVRLRSGIPVVSLEVQPEFPRESIYSVPNHFWSKKDNGTMSVPLFWQKWKQSSKGTQLFYDSIWIQCFCSSIHDSEFRFQVTNHHFHYLSTLLTSLCVLFWTRCFLPFEPHDIPVWANFDPSYLQICFWTIQTTPNRPQTTNGGGFDLVRKTWIPNYSL